MNKFIELLKEKGIVDKLQNTVNRVPIPVNVPDEKRKALLNSAIGQIILMEVKMDEELNDCFDECAIDMFLKAVIEELDIKKDPETEGQSIEDFMKNMLTDIVNTLFE